MRYDTMLRAIDRATARYEAEIRQILRTFAKGDTETTQALVAGLKKPTLKKPLKKARKQYERKAPHWTQRPENKARLKKQLAKATKASVKAATNGAV